MAKPALPRCYTAGMNEPERLTDLTPEQREVHEVIDLGPYTWRHALGTALVAVLIAMWVWWRYAQ
jgi:hypothetical protein